MNIHKILLTRLEEEKKLEYDNMVEQSVLYADTDNVLHKTKYLVFKHSFQILKKHIDFYVEQLGVLQQHQDKQKADEIAAKIAKQKADDIAAAKAAQIAKEEKLRLELDSSKEVNNDSKKPIETLEDLKNSNISLGSNLKKGSRPKIVAKSLHPKIVATSEGPIVPPSTVENVDSNVKKSPAKRGRPKKKK